MKAAKTITRNTHCKDVLVIDQDKVFKAEERKCLREQTRLDSLRRELEDYEQLDQPAFVSWLYTAFALELTELRQLREVLARGFSVLHEVEREVSARGTSYERAFERVARRQTPAETSKKGQPEAPTGFEGFEADDFPEDFFEQEDENFFEDRPERDIPSTPKPKPASGSIKEVYRELVRRLHPDLNTQLSNHQRELWHEVQQAYQERDLARLEQLATMAGVVDGNMARQTTLSDLRKMFLDLKRACAELTKGIRDAKKEPEWHFRATLKDPIRLQRLHTRMAIEIADDKENVEAGIAELEQLFAGWQHARAKPSRKHKQQQRPGKKRSRGRGGRR